MRASGGGSGAVGDSFDMPGAQAFERNRAGFRVNACFLASTASWVGPPCPTGTLGISLQGEGKSRGTSPLGESSFLMPPRGPPVGETANGEAAGTCETSGEVTSLLG